MNKLCEICNKEFIPKKKSIRCCSKKCSQVYKKKYIKNYQKKHRIAKFNNCKICNKKFEIIGNNNTFCSDECKEKSFSQTWRPKVKKQLFKCLICTREFTSNNKTSKYCSDPCRKKGKKLYKQNKRKKENKNSPYRDTKAVFKEPMYRNVKYSANEDRAIDILTSNGFNASSVAEVLGRTRRSIRNRKMEVDIQNFKSPIADKIDKNLYLKEIIKKLGTSQKKNESISNHIIYNNLIKAGFEIFKVTREGAEFDIVALKDNKFFKIQSKTIGFRESMNVFRTGANIFFKSKLTKKGPVYGKYKYNNIDFFIFNCLGIDVTYVIPSIKLRKITKTAQLSFYPHRSQHKYNKMFLNTEIYKERYDLIK